MIVNRKPHVPNRSDINDGVVDPKILQEERMKKQEAHK